MNVIAARFACQSEPQLGADSRTAKVHAATGPCRERCLLSGVHYNGVYDLDAGARLPPRIALCRMGGVIRGYLVAQRSIVRGKRQRE